MKRLLLHHLKLRMLRAVDAIERHKSVLKASHELGVTQPALTRTLHEVEDILGGRIFERHSRGVVMTDFGEVACTGIRRILAQVARLDHDLDRFLAGETRLLSIGAMPPAAVGLLPQLFAKLRTDAPDIHVQLTQGSMEELIPLLNQGVVEMIIGRLFPASTPDEFVRDVLYNEPLCIMARSEHPLLSAPAIDESILAGYKFILPNMSEAVVREVDAAMAAMNLVHAIDMRSVALPFLRELLHTSDHLLISPPMTMAGDLSRGTLRRLDFTVPGPPRPAGLLLRRDYPLSETAQRFVEMMRAYLRENVELF
jgi:LysR family transcriptional regulator, pca operon transcriptional activator